MLGHCPWGTVCGAKWCTSDCVLTQRRTRHKVLPYLTSIYVIPPHRAAPNFGLAHHRLPILHHSTAAQVTPPHRTKPNRTKPNRIAAHLTSHHCTSLYVTSHQSPQVTSPQVTSSHLTSSQIPSHHPTAPTCTATHRSAPHLIPHHHTSPALGGKPPATPVGWFVLA